MTHLLEIMLELTGYHSSNDYANCTACLAVPARVKLTAKNLLRVDPVQIFANPRQILLHKSKVAIECRFSYFTKYLVTELHRASGLCQDMLKVFMITSDDIVRFNRKFWTRSSFSATKRGRESITLIVEVVNVLAYLYYLFYYLLLYWN